MQVFYSLFIAINIFQICRSKVHVPQQSVEKVKNLLKYDATTEATTEATTPVSSTTTVPEVPVPKVTVPDFGTAIGTTLKSFEGRDFYGFMSIPYALPPEGDQRFKYPMPWAGEWDQETEDGEYEANFLRARCIQISLILNITAGREDCLHLSIYTPVFPEENATEVLPVMVWFHGGGYLSGDANLYVPTKLMDKDVMVVVVQYRLGLLGFLAGGTEDAPGNMGLMDMITSLRWIQDNIEYFGGDNDTVTVFGQSAGGASSSWMHMTPLTNGSIPSNKGHDLLHRVIPQSGSALELWTIDDNPNESFQKSAEYLGCSSEATPEDQLICMKTKSADEVNWASLNLYGGDRVEGGLGFRGLCPVIQDDLQKAFPEMEIVIPKDPQDILANGEFMKIPMMAGSVRDEGSLVIGLLYKDFMYPNGHTIDDVEFLQYDLMPMALNAFELTDKSGAVMNSMRVAYFPDAIMGNWSSMVGGMIDMTGVMFLKSGLWQVANGVNRADPDVPIYFYSFEFETDDSLFPWIFSSMLDVPVNGGVGHADELLYLFHLPSKMGERQRNMVSRMTTLWTNFAKYGNPTPDDTRYNWNGEISKWNEYTNDNLNFMLIDDNFQLLQDFSTRWHHDKDIKDGRHSNTPNMICAEPIPDVASQASREDYESESQRADSYKIATGVFEGFVVLAVVAACIFGILLRQKNKVNAIV